MSSILDEQLRLMALKQYGLIKAIKAPDISETNLSLIQKIKRLNNWQFTGREHKVLINLKTDMRKLILTKKVKFLIL